MPVQRGDAAPHARNCRTASKSSPASIPATGWSCRKHRLRPRNESGHFRPADARDDQIAADAALPSGRVRCSAFSRVATIPREEEPQISVPMVDIFVQANGLTAGDAAEQVTKPLEEIVKGINGVEHVYSQTQDDRVMVTARFFTGTSEDDAILRVQAKLRANYDRIPLGHSRAADRRARHQRCRHRHADPDAQARGGRALERAGSLRRSPRKLQAELDQDRQYRPDLYRRRRAAGDQRRARSRKALALRRDAAAARSQDPGRQPLRTGRPVARQRQDDGGRLRPHAVRRARYRPACWSRRATAGRSMCATWPRS